MEEGLVVNQMDGRLALYDLRFVGVSSMGGEGKGSGTMKRIRKKGVEPIVKYEGHVNTYTREVVRLKPHSIPR